MTQAVTVKAIVQCYLSHGGAKMDEVEYQKYKLAILLDWLDREELYAVKHYQNPSGCWIQIPELQPAVMNCCHMDCEFSTVDVMTAVDHLVVHYSQWFDVGKKNQV